MYGGNAIWNKYVLSFFRKVAIVFRCFQSDGEFTQTTHKCMCAFRSAGGMQEHDRMPK